MRATHAQRRRTLPSLAAAWAFSLIATSPAIANIEFRGPSRYSPVASPTAVAIADLDRDGHSDLVVTNGAWHTGAVSIMRGAGDGTFEAPRRIPLGIVPEAVVVEDFDGDDLLDVAATHHGYSGILAGHVAILLGNGDGTFRAAVEYAAGYWVRTLRAVDLDGDQDLDLVTENVVLLGNGDGTFAAAADYGGGDSYAAVADVDQDGHPDIVSTSTHYEYDEEDPYPQACALRLGNGDGTFQAAVGFGRGTWCRDVEIADIDRDGLADVVVANYGGERGKLSGVMLHRGRGDGSFEDGRLLPTALNPMSIAVADLDGDGRLDLLTANNGNDPDFDEHSLTILLAREDGTFERQPELHTGQDPHFVAVGRLDANETLDLVVAAAGQGAVSTFLGNGDGSFGSPDQLLGRRILSLTTADFDHDGFADLVSTNGGALHSNGSASVIAGKGDGTFAAPLDFGSTALIVTAAHLDGDSELDLLGIHETGVSVMLSNGNGTFREASQTYLAPRWPGIPTVADFDHDGHMDLAVPQGWGADAASILLGRGDGSFGAISRCATGYLPQTAATGDLDGDGRTDLVVGLWGYHVSVLLGNGDGTFAPQVTYSTGHYWGGHAPVGLADLDEDGHLDVVNGNLVRLGNGDGTLQAAIEFDVRSDERMGLVLEDFDGDHHVDLASLHGNEERIVSVHPGRGDGTFGPRVDYGTGAWPRALAAGDFDGDGRTDLTVGNYRSESISILLNRSQAPVISVSFQLRPAVVNARADARWITGILEAPVPYLASDIDIGSIRLNGVVPVDRSAPGAPPREGSGEMVVRFDRAALAAILPAGDQVPVTVTGRLGRDAFEASTTVRVLGRGPTGSSGRAARHALRLHIVATTRTEANGLRLSVTLGEEGVARLDVLDVAGRVAVSRSLDSFPAGPHEIELEGARALSPGVYFVRLRQGSQVEHARAAILR